MGFARKFRRQDQKKTVYSQVTIDGQTGYWEHNHRLVEGTEEYNKALEEFKEELKAGYTVQQKYLTPKIK